MNRKNWKDSALEILEMLLADERYYVQAHADRVAFYTKLQSTLLAALIIGGARTSSFERICILFIGAALLLLISEVAIHATARFYRRSLEAVAARAKVEFELGMTSVSVPDDAPFWGGEPLISPKRVSSMMRERNSDAWVIKLSEKGTQRWTRSLFRLFQGAACVGLLVATVFLQRYGAESSQKLKKQPTKAEQGMDEAESSPSLLKGVPAKE